MHLFLFSRGMGKGNVAVHKKCLQGNNDAIFGWLVGDLFGIWLFWGWFGLFVGGLAGLFVLWVVWLICGYFGWFVGGLACLWVVSSFAANGLKLFSSPLIFHKIFEKLQINYLQPHLIWLGNSINFPEMFKGLQFTFFLNIW